MSTCPRKRSSKKDKKPKDSPKLLHVEDSPVNRKRSHIGHHRNLSDAPLIVHAPLGKKHSDQTSYVPAPLGRKYSDQMSYVRVKKTPADVVDSDSGRRQYLDKIHLQRSCSLDALDDRPKSDSEERTSPKVVVSGLRRTSTEVCVVCVCVSHVHVVVF